MATSMATLGDIVARIGVKMEELTEAKKETERVLAESRRENERALAESRKENERRLAESQEKIKLELAESRRKADESYERLNETVDKWIGFFGNKIGYLVELILIPGIKKKMNEYGHQFNTLAPRRQFYRRDGRTFAEIDLFLEDGTEVMAVEVKTRLAETDVEYHLKRLKLLRELASGIKEKTLYAAVAGLQIDDDAREKALKLGMYVIEMIEDDKSVNVIKPDGELGKW